MEKSNIKFWDGKRVLLTGHTGFKGRWMENLLRALHTEVRGFSLPCEDLRRESDITAAIEAFRPDITLHFASFGFVQECRDDPMRTWQTNVGGLVNLLEALRLQEGCGSILVVTSDKCYRNDGSTILTEESPLGGSDPYSASKAAQEHVAASYRDTYGMPIATARASNIIGGGDPVKTRLLPYLTDRFSRGETASIRKPNAIRSWQNVLDVLDGYLLLAQRVYEDPQIYCGAYNFGPGPEGFWTVGQLAESLCAEYENAELKIGEPLVNVKEADVLRLDSTKAKEVLGWQPHYSMEETLRQTAEVDAGCALGEGDIYDIYIHRHLAQRGEKTYV